MAPTSAVQKAQRRASLGISLRHSGHLRVVGSAGGSRRDYWMSQFIGFTTKKKITAAKMRNEISTVMKLP